MAQSSRELYCSAILADFRPSGLTHVRSRSVHRRESRNRFPTPRSVTRLLFGLRGHADDL